MDTEQRKRILVVDDSLSVRRQLDASLSGAGYDVIEASNGLEALEEINADHGLSLVITDINMPWMNGLELLERIQPHIHDGLPVVLLTAESSFLRRGKALGAKTWIIKPFKEDQLIEAVNRLIQ